MKSRRKPEVMPGRAGDGPPGGSVTDIAFLVPTWTLQRRTKESPGSLRLGGASNSVLSNLTGEPA